VLKRLAIILPLLFALLSFKVSASVLVLTGGLISTESAIAEVKENSIHHWVDSEESNSFEEFIEEQEEEEESESFNHVEFNFYSLNHKGFFSTRQIKCRKVKRKLFMLYKSYKIDCCKF
jgi:hypothetical protein